jgi:biopolymer transport protein ExbD
MGRPQKHDPEIDVLPYMDSMVITLNMICLIIIIMIIPILENTQQVSSLPSRSCCARNARKPR